MTPRRSRTVAARLPCKQVKIAMGHSAYLLEVFPAGPVGGNPTVIVPDAAGMSDADMQDVARTHGHESGFVLPAPAGSGCDFQFRYWVPNHEMEMCGHATVGAVWLLDKLRQLPSQGTIVIQTKSGRVEAAIDRSGVDGQVEISQPQGILEVLPASATAAVLSVLGITADDLAPYPVYNACTSRTKTLVPLKSPAALDALRPDFRRMEQVCEQIASTGLYPYVVCDQAAQVFEARQFPKAVGYPEDAATGIAAAALAFGLLEDGRTGRNQRIVVRQGRAMGRPSEIRLRFRLDQEGQVRGCWLGGPVRMMKTG